MKLKTKHISRTSSFLCLLTPCIFLNNFSCISEQLCLLHYLFVFYHKGFDIHRIADTAVNEKGDEPVYPHYEGHVVK